MNFILSFCNLFNLVTCFTALGVSLAFTNMSIVLNLIGSASSPLVKLYFFIKF